MQASADCIPCVLRQALSAARRVTDDPWLQRKLLFAVMEKLPALNFDRSPAEVSYDTLRFAAKYLGVADPFQGDKTLHNEKMAAIENDMREAVRAADDPLRQALLFALAGNIIDLGILDPQDIEARLFRDARTLEPAIDDYEALRAALRGARSVLYLLDNAGEVVCDKLVIEQLGVHDITCVVRRSPIINDVTRKDVQAVGLERLAKIVDIGADALGVPLNLCSAEFRETFAGADVVLAKGQANFETLDEAPRPVFHVLRAKCAHMADHLDVPPGAAVIVRTPREEDTESPSEGKSPRQS
ncbi:MAG: damage-control phosphatase ARMT1 family protein [Planctomycetota bacterium]